MNHIHLNSLGSFDNGHSHGSSLSSLGSLPGLDSHYLGNSPLARTLRGTDMPEDRYFAKAELNAGLKHLSQPHYAAVSNVLKGSCMMEDKVLASSALKSICRGW